MDGHSLSNQSTPILFSPTKFIWKSKAPSKAKAFVGLVAGKKVNTNDLLQVRIPFKTRSLNHCTLCMGSGELIDHCFYFVQWLKNHGTSYLD